MKKQQSGFTLIELVAVIVILGALAVVALPKFINLQDKAERAATEGVAGNLAAGSAINLASVLAGNTTDATVVTKCSDVPNTLADGTLPTDYKIGNPSTTLGSANGDSAECQVQNTATGSTASVSFRAYYASY